MFFTMEESDLQTLSKAKGAARVIEAIAMVLMAVGFYCVGYIFGHKKAFETKLEHMSRVYDELAAENYKLREKLHDR